MDKKLKARIVTILRRAWLRDKERGIAYTAARRGRGLYECCQCPKGTLHGPKDVQIDHIEGCVPITGATTIDEYVNRLFKSASRKFFNSYDQYPFLSVKTDTGLERPLLSLPSLSQRVRYIMVELT